MRGPVGGKSIKIILTCLVQEAARESDQNSSFGRRFNLTLFRRVGSNLTPA